MLRSLASRIFAIGGLVSAGLLVAAALLLQSGDRTRQGFIWVGQNEEVIREVDELVGDIREAESGQRGFLLTHSAAYLDTFNARIDSVGRRVGTLRRLVGTDRDQRRRVDELGRVITLKVQTLRAPLALADQGRFAAADAFVASGRGRTLMEEVARRADEINAAEQSLLAYRLEDANRLAEWNHDLIEVGGPVLALTVFGLMFLLVRGVRRSLSDLLAAMRALAGGRAEARAGTASGYGEIDELARVYNGLADQLTDTAARQAASDVQLQSANTELRTRGDAIEMLGGMAHRMQASRTDEELADVLRCFLPRVLPDAPGALYVHNNSRNLLHRVASWGDAGDLPDGFAPDACWGLRRGQGHSVPAEGADVRCRHVAPGAGYHCEPVLAGGEVVGLLYLAAQVAPADRFRLAALTENVALALVNQRLQRGLREQSIRDALTGLFNRRYMEEALGVEVARAQRSGAPLSVVMCDVDHFKRFNDEWGHAAGDAVLQQVAAVLQAQFRDGDVVCRYGGEEFAVIAAGAEPEALAARLEAARAAVSSLSVRHEGRSLGRVTLSLGAASLRPGQGGEDAVRAADAALYRAKQEGRDRSVLAPGGPRALAA